MVRHTDVNHLWFQTRCALKLVPLTKVDGTKNPSDLLTKHLTVVVIEKHAEYQNLGFIQGISQKTASAQPSSEAGGV